MNHQLSEHCEHLVEFQTLLMNTSLETRTNQIRNCHQFIIK